VPVTWGEGKRKTYRETHVVVPFCCTFWGMYSKCYCELRVHFWGGTSQNISYFNCCWFELAVRSRSASPRLESGFVLFTHFVADLFCSEILPGLSAKKSLWCAVRPKDMYMTWKMDPMQGCHFTILFVRCLISFFSPLFIWAPHCCTLPMTINYFLMFYICFSIIHHYFCGCQI
jgi:hypothetical protein